jgi:DNA ligase-1
MLADDADLTKLRFPLLASAKLDGVRAIVRDGVVYSRSNKPIPSKWVQANLSHIEHFDGELIAGDPRSKSAYRDTLSQVMSFDKTEGCSFYAFDHIQRMHEPYSKRHHRLSSSPNVVVHEQHVVTCLSTLIALEEQMLNEGYEGLILRDPNALYKQGRSTAKEGYLLKMKRFVDSEATVIGFEERMHNANVKTVDELGYSTRSSHQDNLVGRGDLGAIQVEWNGAVFSIGTGFDDAERTKVWAKRDSYIGKFAKFKYFPVGIKDLPRHPVFLGWRDPIDM